MGDILCLVVRLELVDEIFNRRQAVSSPQAFSYQAQGIVYSSSPQPPQKFKYRRVAGSILAVVLLAAAVTGAAIGVSSRTGSNSEEAVAVQEASENSASNQEAISEEAANSPAVNSSLAGQTDDAQSASLSDGSSFPQAGDNAEVADGGASRSQNLVLVQDSRDDSSSSDSESDDEASLVTASVNDAVTKLLPSAVAIYVRADDAEEEMGFNSAGSGIIIDDSGLILSAAHVFTGQDNSEHITTDGILIELDNGFFTSGTLVGYDTAADVAVVRFDPAGLDFEAADVADLSELQVGDQVIAIGAPYGYVNSVNVGYVSGLNRVETLAPNEDLPAAVPTIQTDAPINSGNSGGMLANTNGEVIGVNVFIRTQTSIAGASGGNVGVGFAVPIDIAMRVADTILAGEQFFYGSLGVTGRFTPEEGPPGPTILSVVPGQPADLAGIEVGDNIIRFEGKIVRTMNELASFVQFHPPGEYASIVVYRNGQEVRVTATIGTSSKESLTTIIN